MTNPTETAEQKPSSSESEQQPTEKNSPDHHQNDPGSGDTTDDQIKTNVTQDKSVEGTDDHHQDIIMSSTTSCATSTTGSKAMKKKRELDHVPSGAPTCYVCQRSFGSWKAVFGHLRAHDRKNRGAFPPPSFTPEGSPPERNININADDHKTLKEQLAPTLLNLAHQTMQKMSQDHIVVNTSTAAAAGASSSRRIISRDLEIDLNEPTTTTTTVLLDLNNPPPPENENDDDDDHVNNENN